MESSIMSDNQVGSLYERIESLREEHRVIDQELSSIINDPIIDDLEIQRLKKRKLFLKDSIALLESKLIPDITA